MPPAADERKRKTAKDRLRGAVQQNVAVLDEKKVPDNMFPAHTIEDERVRTALKRNRNYGDLPLDIITPDPEQVRIVDTASDSFQELVDSVREHGVLEPITVRWIEAAQHFQIITGERRYQAAKRVQLETIPAIVKDVDDTQKAVHQLVENLQRENMNPIEEARAFHRYLAATGATQRDLAKKIGKSPAYVSGVMSLLEKLDRREQEEIAKVPPAERPGKSLIYEALRTEDAEIRLSILRGQLTRSEAREIVQRAERKRPVGRPKFYVKRLALEQQDATVTITFRKAEVTDEEIEKALMEALEVYEHSIPKNERLPSKRSRAKRRAS